MDTRKPKVMVGLRDGKSVDGLMELACEMAKGMDAELIALHVVEMPLATPLGAEDEVIDRPAKQVLSLACRAASRRSSRPITTRFVRAREAAKAIVEEVKKQGVRLLVMGYHQPHGVGEVLLGSVVRQVACHVPCRVIVQIPPAQAPEQPVRRCGVCQAPPRSSL